MYLNCHSYYSLRYGTLSIQQLVATAARCGVQALALTDINATTGVFDFIRACRAAKIKAIVGIEFRRDNQCLYIALAKNHTGFYEMNRHLSRYNITEKPLPCAAPEFSNVIVIYPLDKAPQFLRPFEYIGIRIEELLSLRRSPVCHLAHRYVVLHPVTFSSPKEYTLHRLLRAVDYNTLYTKIQPEQC
ncbi:MAG: PHP domain-containing protein, partial [Bacteroidota bacterium]